MQYDSLYFDGIRSNYYDIRIYNIHTSEWKIYLKTLLSKLKQ